ncbi:MAG: glycosyltransferase family 4 protein [Calditrichaeota bacterium]|nr:glycosyltransferase family 4 protein [Calditrichota bacterium]
MIYSFMTQQRYNTSLIIFFDFILYSDTQNYWVSDSHILFIESVRKAFAKSTLCARLSGETAPNGLQIPNDITVQPLPFYTDLLQLLIKKPLLFWKIKKRFEQVIGKTDILWLCWPHPVSFMLILIYGRTHFIFLSVRENIEDVIREKYPFYNKFFGILLVKLMNVVLRLFFPKLTIFCTGSEMYQRYRPYFEHVYQIKSPLISNQPIEVKTELDQNSITKLLFVGRLERVKGLSYLIEAMSIVNATDSHIHLDIVGTGTEIKHLTQLIEKYKLNDSVTLHGYVPYGEALFDFYRYTDLFILPALTEGFPKVIDEARAFNLPIIATLSGGIGNELSHGENVWIIEKKSAESIADAILTLKNDQELAQRISRPTETIQPDYYSDKIISIVQSAFQSDS